MRLLKSLKNGTEYYLLSDGRLGAIYPSTGYARVSYAINKKNAEFGKRQRERNMQAIADDKMGKLMRYQINPVRKVDEYHEITMPLYYNFFDTQRQYQNEWRKAYYKFEANHRVLYPNDRQKLYDLLQKFNLKNCQP